MIDKFSVRCGTNDITVAGLNLSGQPKDYYEYAYFEYDYIVPTAFVTEIMIVYSDVNLSELI